MPDRRAGGKVLIADTQFIAIEALKSLLSSEGYDVAATTARKELIDLLSTEPISLLITDYILFDYRSLNDLKEIVAQQPGMGTLVLCNSIGLMQIRELNNAGIRNIALKTDDRVELLHAAASAMKGKKAYSGSVLDILLKHEDPAEEPCLLTATEIEIVRMISTGLTTKEIASRKHISFHTVMTHRKNIFRKLGVTSSPELLMYAMKSGLIDNIEYHI